MIVFRSILRIFAPQSPEMPPTPTFFFWFGISEGKQNGGNFFEALVSLAPPMYLPSYGPGRQI